MGLFLVGLFSVGVAAIGHVPVGVAAVGLVPVGVAVGLVPGGLGSMGMALSCLVSVL